MISSISSTLSAIKAFGEKMGVTASNVANAQTEGFKKSRATLTEGSRNDVQVEVTQINTPGPSIVEVHDDGIAEKEMSNVNLAEEIPETITAQRGLEVNLTVIKTQDEMLGSIIDMVG
ncbi:MAG: flagellar biosynthesis protein FlgC [Desulfobacterales bacterium]|nr:MAG: flagellar biosynthesis protein FlgC [Desulfobacterales bacterium]UCD90261.1 MAG: flagellar biosynthesis protein FlgC [Desulfobacterales bacterium]